MPRPKSAIPLQEHKINLFKGDLQRLQDLFPAQGGSAAVRQLVRNFIKRVEASQAPLDLSLPQVDLKELIHD